MNGIFEHLYIYKELNEVLFEPVCAKYGISLTELAVLLFLDGNLQQDTATDIVEKMKIAKSSVSASVRNLEEKGLIEGYFEGSNRRTIHLRVCEDAKKIVKEGRQAQKKFLSVIFQGFSEE